MKKELSYILKLRNALKEENRNMPIFQNGSAIIVENNRREILLEKKSDRDMWCLPGGLQELGETFEEVAIRELKEETGLTVTKDNLILLGVVSGESRKNNYPNGDIVYNNTVLYLVKKYIGKLDNSYKEETDDGTGTFKLQQESEELKFFSMEDLPKNKIDEDLISIYKDYINKI